MRNKVTSRKRSWKSIFRLARKHVKKCGLEEKDVEAAVSDYRRV